jgi:uncharacterized membrane protein YphA (DoxX/SURF4 family)
LALVLAIFQILDSVACVTLPRIRAKLDRLRCPPEVRRVLPWLKLTSGLGLIAGLWFPLIGVVVCLALVIYFVIALSFHQRVEDRWVRYLPATAMMLFVMAVMLVSFIPEV